MSNILVDQNRNADPLFTYKEDGVAQDINAAELTFGLYETLESTVALFTKQNTAAGGGDAEISWFTDGTNGRFYVHILPANTVNLNDDQQYHWEVMMTLSGKTTTIGRGTMSTASVLI